MGPGRNVNSCVPVRSGDVGGHEVGRELDALEPDVERQRERADEQRLGRPGDAFEQHVTAGEQAHHHLPGGGFLAQHHGPDGL